MIDVPPRPAWHQRAACRGIGPNVMYPTRGQKAQLAEALTYCARCPVTDHCLAYALDTGDKFGIWAVPERQRRKLRRALRQPAERLDTGRTA